MSVLGFKFWGFLFEIGVIVVLVCSGSCDAVLQVPSFFFFGGGSLCLLMYYRGLNHYQYYSLGLLTSLLNYKKENRTHTLECAEVALPFSALGSRTRKVSTSSNAHAT